MNILTYDSDDKLNEAAANIIVGQIQTTPRAVLGLATGELPSEFINKSYAITREGW